MVCRFSLSFDQRMPASRSPRCEITGFGCDIKKERDVIVYFIDLLEQELTRQKNSKIVFKYIRKNLPVIYISMKTKQTIPIII